MKSQHCTICQPYEFLLAFPWHTLVLSNQSDLTGCNQKNYLVEALIGPKKNVTLYLIVG